MIVIPGLLLASRIVVAAVFGLAGAGKLVDRAELRRGLSKFGLSGTLVGPAAAVLPLAELAVAGALLPTASARLGAAGSLFLLALFSGVVASNLARGRKPDCHCFGQLRSAPIGVGTLVRNGALAGLSGFVLWGGPGAGVGTVLDRVGELRGEEAVGLFGGLFLLGLIVVQGWFLVNLTRQQGRLLLRLDAIEGLGERPGLALGTAAPSFSLPSLSEHTVTLEALVAAGRPVMTIFIAPDCGPCNALLPEVARWQRDYREILRIALISRGDVAANRERAKEHRLEEVLIQQDGEVSEAYRAEATPSAVRAETGGS